MLSFYVVRGIQAEYILSLSALEKAFYLKSMELYYKEKEMDLKIASGRYVIKNDVGEVII